MEIVGVSVCCASSSHCSVAVSSLSQSYYTYFRFIYFLFCFIVSAQSYILNPHVLQVYNFTHNPKHFKIFANLCQMCVPPSYSMLCNWQKHIGNLHFLMQCLEIWLITFFKISYP